MARKWRRGFVPVVAAMLLLSACTGGDKGPGPDATATGAEQTLIEPELSATTPPPLFGPEDTVLNVAIQEPSSLDPLRLNDPGASLIARQLYEGLTRWDPVLEKVKPAAAESWTASRDGTTFTFKLRQGMTFHDGSPVTAKDFVFAFDRIALKANASDLAYLLHDVVGFGDVNQTGTAGHMSGLSAPDDLTLVIRLSRPYQDLPSVLTHPALVPLSRRAVSSPDRFLTEPTGNGPFQIAQPWSPGQSVILKAFPGFIQTPDLDGIRFLAYPDAAASWIDFVKGDVDVSEVPAGQVSDAANRFGERGFVPFLKAEYVGVNVGSGNLKDPTLRKAINLAIDRAALARTVYNGTLQEPRGIVPAGLPGFEENLCVDLCRFDPDTAAALVKNLPKKERRVELSFTKGVPQTRAANAIARFLRHAGLKASVKGYDFPPYLKLLQSGGQELYRLGWIAEYPSADVFLDPLFSSGSPDNHSGFASTTVDRMLAQAHSSPSPGKRLHLYVEAERAILKALPIIPIGSFVTHWAARPEVKEIHFDVMGGFDANQVFVSGG